MLFKANIRPENTLSAMELDIKTKITYYRAVSGGLSLVLGLPVGAHIKNTRSQRGSSLASPPPTKEDPFVCRKPCLSWNVAPML